MAGTREGGLKAAETNRKRHGKNFYQRIGQVGGSNGNTGGFASNPELAKVAGRIGGLRSRRGPSERTQKILKRHGKKILAMAAKGIYYGRIAEKFDINKGTCLRFIEKNLYGE